MKREIISTNKAPSAVGPYSQAIRDGDLLFVSGQLGIDPSTGKMSGGDLGSQTKKALENMKGILEAAGGSMQSLVKITLFLVNMDDFAAVNKVYAECFSRTYPARCCVEVSRLPLNALIMVDGIAVLYRDEPK